jgi:methionine sulfoxide reductase heme-binding subunit
LRSAAPLRAAVARFLDARYVLWSLLGVPAAFMLYGYRQGTVFYGEVLHASGELAAQLLILTLAITPLRLTFPDARWVRWLAARRRYLGVAVFGYSALHAAVYVYRQPDFARVLDDALGASMWTGWLALLVISALAATSNDLSVRLLRSGWKRLHRGVHAAAVLTFAHWVLSAFDPIPGYIHLGVLAVIEGYRVWRVQLNRRAGVGAGSSP